MRRAALAQRVQLLRVTQRIRKISESLVDFARVRKHYPEPVPLRHLIDDAWNLVAIDEKAARVTFANHAAGADIVTGNSDRLIQVFVNLFRNALYAIRPTGSIVVNVASVLV